MLFSSINIFQHGNILKIGCDLIFLFIIWSWRFSQKYLRNGGCSMISIYGSVNDFIKFLVGKTFADPINHRSPVHPTTPSSILAWFSEDAARDQKAQQVVAVSHIFQIFSRWPYKIWATCSASNADIHSYDHLCYWLTIHPTGSATCTCYDWITNGGACKHLHALRILIQLSSKLKLPLSTNSYHFPVSWVDAEINARWNKAWYGPYLDISVTLYTNASTISKSNAGSPSTDSPDMLMNYLPNSAHPASLAPPGYEPVSAGALRDASLFQHKPARKRWLHYRRDDLSSASESESDYSDTPSNLAPGPQQLLMGWTYMPLPFRLSTGYNRMYLECCLSMAFLLYFSLVLACPCSVLKTLMNWMKLFTGCQSSYSKWKFISGHLPSCWYCH